MESVIFGGILGFVLVNIFALLKWRRSTETQIVRVWRFRLELTIKFVERFHGSATPILLPSLRGPTEALNELVIEVFENRVRIHRWITPLNSEGEVAGQQHYRWFDPKGAPFHGSGLSIWSYETNDMRGPLVLSLKKRDEYYELVLWFNDLESHTDIPSKDIVFTVPLEPKVLCDQHEPDSLVTAKEGKKASGVEPFPHDDYDWRHECREGNDWQWTWFLSMQTFRH